jgi:hypothetical protein
VVAFTNTAPKGHLYEIVPKKWKISEEEVYFPQYKRCRLEKAVEEGLLPKPADEYERYSVKILHCTG